MGVGRHLAQAFQFGVAFIEMPFGVEIAVGTGVEFDDFGPDAGRGFDLLFVGGDKDGNAATCFADWCDEMGEMVFFACDFKAALSSAFLAFFGNDTNGVRLVAKGDLGVDAHHTVEDVGIALGQALREAIGPAEGIRRYGSQLVPMADAKVEVSVDISNRPYLVYQVELANDRIGSFDTSLVEDFFYAFVQNGGLDLHVELRYGTGPHHALEAIFKGTARALRTALERDPRTKGLPTVKGEL